MAHAARRPSKATVNYAEKFSQPLFQIPFGLSQEIIKTITIKCKIFPINFSTFI